MFWSIITEKRPAFKSAWKHSFFIIYVVLEDFIVSHNLKFWEPRRERVILKTVSLRPVL